MTKAKVAARASALNLGSESSKFTGFGVIYFIAVTGLRASTFPSDW